MSRIRIPGPNTPTLPYSTHLSLHMIASRYAIDYQVHSLCAHDGRATIGEQCARAVELGLDEIGFTEHKDFDPQDPAVHHFDYDAYRQEI